METRDSAETMMARRGRLKGERAVVRVPDIPPCTLKLIATGEESWLTAITFQLARPFVTLAKKAGIAMERVWQFDERYEVPTDDEFALMARYLQTTPDRLDAARLLSPLTPGEPPRRS